MAWGFRRSLRIAGPLHLNLSKSGLGLSLGIPGLHVGVSPKRRTYVRAGLPGTGIYYRKSIGQPRPAHTRAPKPAALDTPWMLAVKALLGGDPGRCLEIASAMKPTTGPAVHVEVDADVVVTLIPDACGIAVIKAEALERLGRKDEALQVADEAAGAGCHVGEIVALELRGHDKPQ
ncbi:MAG: DUF4236 domain-containing protein [Actinomycetota bacterium]